MLRCGHEIRWCFAVADARNDFAVADARNDVDVLPLRMR